MNVLVLNAGSSSFKAAYFTSDGLGSAEAAWEGTVRWTELPARAELRWAAGGSSGTTLIDVDAHGAAADALVAAARLHVSVEPQAIGHRVVHGFDQTTATLISHDVRQAIERGAEIAPLHNPAALTGIDAMARAFPDISQVAVFDTAFHATLPQQAVVYPVPYAWYQEWGARRYGFHGISHEYCAHEVARILQRDLADLRIVNAHLGNGCSLAAIAGGRSVDTTMGFTPLEGLMMGSRSGSVDPGLLLFLQRRHGLSAAELERDLNDESGLKGVSGISEDLRAVLEAARTGHARAQLALDIYVHRLRAGIAAMAAAMNGLDVLSFTGGVGENSTYIREQVCDGLRFLGVSLDAQRNGAGPHDSEIGDDGAPTRVCLVTTREELAIARIVARVSEGGPPDRSPGEQAKRQEPSLVRTPGQ